MDTYGIFLLISWCQIHSCKFLEFHGNSFHGYNFHGIFFSRLHVQVLNFFMVIGINFLDHKCHFS